MKQRRKRQSDHLSFACMRAVLALAMLGLGLAPGQAQQYPHRHITLVVASAPGGPADSAARIIVGPMSAKLGQQIVIENSPGSGGMIGAARVARSEGDGYTLLLHQTGLTIAPALYPKLGFDVAKDFAPIGLVNTSYSMLIGRKSIPADDFAGLLKWMKGAGGPAQFAHPGTGTLGHLQTLLFAKSVGANINPLPYRGIAPIMNDLIGDHVDLVWSGLVASAPQITGGKVKAFGYGAPKRAPVLPNVPAMTELGHPDMAISFWHALYAPASTPRPIIERLSQALRAALDDPQVIKAYADSGTEMFPPDQRTPEAAAAFVRGEVERWAKVVRENNVQAEQ